MDRKKSSRVSRSPELQHDGPPVYQQIADRLREDITAGRLLPGARVDGENDLMRRYGVARSTARDALAILRHAGLIETVRGLGTFVRKTDLIPRYGSPRLHEKTSFDAPFTVDSVRVDSVAADERIAQALGCTPGAEVIVRKRRYLLDARPVCLSTLYLPAEIAAGTALTEPGTDQAEIERVLSKMKSGPAEYIEDLRARMPNPDEARQLNLSPGVPVVAIIRTGLSKKSTPVTMEELIFDATAYRFVYNVAM